jgi:signal transduction histidine kinase/CheY-like chemotaxis protein
MSENFGFNLFALPVIIIGVLLMVLVIISWKRVNQMGLGYFNLLLLCCMGYSFLYGLELLALNTATINFLVKLQFFPASFLGPTLLCFVIYYSDNRKYLSQALKLTLFGIPTLFLIALLTNDYHQLFLKEVSSSYNGFFEAVDIQTGAIYPLYASYISLTVLISNLILIKMLLNIPHVYIKQVLVLLIGTLIPWTGYILSLFELIPYGIDIVPFALGVSGLILYIGLFRFRLFEVSPIAFKTIFENLLEGVVILDDKGRVIAINKAASQLFLSYENQEIKSVNEIIKIFPEIEKLYSSSSNASTEFVSKDRKTHFKVSLNQVDPDQMRRHIDDQIFYLLFYDVTAQKRAQEKIKANELTLQRVNDILRDNEKMLTSVAFATKELLSNAEISIAIQKAITILGDGAGVDRAYLFENFFDDEGNLFTSQRFEWSARGVPSEINNPNLQYLPFQMFGEVLDSLADRKFYMAIVSQIKHLETKELLEKQNIKSILIIPIFVDHIFWGFVGFDDCHRSREWGEAETALLISFADSISNAIERKNLEFNLIKSIEKAKEASVAKSEFLANMSHEIRTPLNGVIGFSDLLSRTSLSQTQKEYLKSIVNSGNILLELINDILDFSKIEAGKLEINTTAVRIMDLLNDSIKVIKATADKKGLKLKVIKDKNLPEFVTADAFRIKQVLINLLSNSVKFTSSGVVELGVYCTAIDEPAKKVTIVFTVKDTGIGISPEKKQIIFEAFTQEDTSTTRKYGGTGLGLTISNKLLKLMGSKLKVTSETGKGSTFSFELELPITEGISEVKEESVKQASESQLAEPKKPTKNKILLVDDNPVNMLLAKTIVKNLLVSAKIFEAKDGKEAVDLFQKDTPDLIFMDIQMPEMSGYEATKAIRAIEKGKSRVPIIALTAGTVKGEQERCIEAGMDDYLSKPVLVADIATMIERYLNKPFAPKESRFLAKFDEYRMSDPEFFKELLIVSKQNLIKLKGDFETALNGDLFQIKQVTHAIKGVALNLNFKNLVDLTIALSQLTAIDQKENKKITKDLLAELDSILAQMDQEMEKLKE